MNINIDAMPNVGDILVRKMYTPSFGLDIHEEPCIVTFVNHKNKYYTVKFLDSITLKSADILLPDSRSTISPITN